MSRELEKAAKVALDSLEKAPIRSIMQRRAMNLLREALGPEPTQDEEPVAWTCQDELNALGTDVTCYMYAEPLVGETNIPLFLHPTPRPEFVRLSEEEIADIEAGIPPKMNLAEAKKKFARAIEDALEEKNTINRSDPDSVDLQSRCRGDKP